MFFNVRIYISNKTSAIVNVMNFHYLLRLRAINWGYFSVLLFDQNLLAFVLGRSKGHVPQIL